MMRHLQRPSSRSRLAILATSLLLAIGASASETSTRPSPGEEEDVSGVPAGIQVPVGPDTIRISTPFRATRVHVIGGPRAPLSGGAVAIPGNARAPRIEAEWDEQEGIEALSYDLDDRLYGHVGYTTPRRHTFRQPHRGHRGHQADRRGRTIRRHGQPNERLLSDDGFARAQYAFYKSGLTPRPSGLTKPRTVRMTARGHPSVGGTTRGPTCRR